MSYHHGNLREALLQAATDLLVREGPQRLSLRATARQAGVSPTAPYRHFAEKEELLAAVGQRGFARLQQELEARLQGVEEPREQLHQVGLGYVEFAQHNPHLFRLMFGPLMAKEVEYPDLTLSCQASFGVLLGVIAEGQARGVFRQGDPEVLGTAAWSTVHGIAHLALDGQLPPRKQQKFQSIQGMLRAVGDLLIDGLVERPC